VVLCVVVAYEKALSLTNDSQRPLVSVALAMCCHAADDYDDAKFYLLPL